MEKSNKLTTIQNELKVPKSQYNAFGKYKYRNSEDILEAVKPLLLKYDCGLVVKDELFEISGLVVCKAIAVFTDQNTTEEGIGYAGIDINKKGMDIAQCFGSSSSYARKCALNGLFLIDDNKDPDFTNKHNEISIDDAIQIQSSNTPKKMITAENVEDMIASAKTLAELSSIYEGYNGNKDIIKPSLAEKKQELLSKAPQAKETDRITRLIQEAKSEKDLEIFDEQPLTEEQQEILQEKINSFNASKL